MFLDNIVLCSGSKEKVENDLERRRFALERRGMRVGWSKTNYLCLSEVEGVSVKMGGQEIKK